MVERMDHSHSAAYANGVLAARKAIDAGVPRWVETSSKPYGQCIHPETGLPYLGLSGPPNLAESNQSFARGFNNEILAALGSGGIEVDFRPLLMTRGEIERELDRSLVGTLSDDNPRIDSPNGDFSLSLRRPKPNPRAKRAKAVTWICYEHESGGRWPSLYTYEGPWRVALGRNGRVLIFETE